MEEYPLVSVVIPCRNEGGAVARCLDSVFASDYPPERMEVIVADGSSEEATRRLLAGYAARQARLRVIDNPRRSTPAALNLALAAARGEFIQRVDAHSVLSPDYIARAVGHLNSSGAWCAGGLMRTVAAAPGPSAAAIGAVLSHPFGVGNSRFRTAAGSRRGRPRSPSRMEAMEADAVFNGCWRREVFEQLGGFDERLERSQDIEFSRRIRRAGGRLVLLPTIETGYFAKATPAAFWRQSWTNGVWAILPAAWLGSLAVGPRHLAPLALVVGLVTMLGFAAAVPGLRGTSAGVAAVTAIAYMAANLTASAHLARRERDPRLALSAPFAFAALHLGYGAGSLWGALRVAWIRARHGRAAAQCPPPDPMRHSLSPAPGHSLHSGAPGAATILTGSEPT